VSFPLRKGSLAHHFSTIPLSSRGCGCAGNWGKGAIGGKSSANPSVEVCTESKASIPPSSRISLKWRWIGPPARPSVCCVRSLQGATFEWPFQRDTQRRGGGTHARCAAESSSGSEHTLRTMSLLLLLLASPDHPAVVQASFKAEILHGRAIYLTFTMKSIFCGYGA